MVKKITSFALFLLFCVLTFIGIKSLLFNYLLVREIEEKEFALMPSKIINWAQTKNLHNPEVRCNSAKICHLTYNDDVNHIHSIEVNCAKDKCFVVPSKYNN